MEKIVDSNYEKTFEYLKSPLISVVLPVYNVAFYIEEAISSILNQTIQDFEVIVVDDCSTDKTISLIRSFDDERIKIIEKKENKGLVDSLNIGFFHARGKYIARMDGDDVNLSSRFEKQLNVLESNPDIKACGCWLQEFGASNKIITHKEKHEEIVPRMLISCPMSLGSVMLNRKWAIEFLFDEDKKHVEDYDFWSRTAWSGKFYNIQEVLYYYRVHINQVSTIHNAVQKAGDLKIKLFLFKKFHYNEASFPDELILNMLSLKSYVSVNDFLKFMDFLKTLQKLNKKRLVFSQFQLDKTLNIIKEKTIHTLFFKPTDIGVNKKWRQKAFLQLPLSDVWYILKLKIIERKKCIKNG